MADRLTLKGHNDITEHIGGELSLYPAPSGRDFHTYPRWWNKKGTIQYEEVTIFNVTRAAGDIQVVIPTSQDTVLELRWDENTETLSFPVHRGVDRILITDTDRTPLQEYQFSRISGGSVLKRIISSLPAPTIGNVTLGIGTTTVTTGATWSFQALTDGDATDLVYNWTTTDGGAVLQNADQAIVGIEFSTTGTFDVICEVTSGLASDSPQQLTLSVNVSLP